jgi:hypothetical protein
LKFALTLTLSRRERGLTAVSQETRRPEKNRSIMDSMSLFQVTGYPVHTPIGSLSLWERARVRGLKLRIFLVLTPERWQTANPFTPFVLRLYANVF